MSENRSSKLTQITVFGTLAVRDGDRLSDIMKSPKGCAIVAYLLVTGTVKSREQIADLLWDATTTAQALNRLRSLLNRLRADLPPEVVIGRNSLHLHPLPNSDIDWITLHNGLATQNDDELTAALTAYKGELLDGFYLPDAPRFNEWVTIERENVRQRVRAAYRRLFSAYLAGERSAQAADSARRWLALDLFDEEARRALMQALALDGNITAALAQFEQCRRLLWEELGAEPELATLQLAEQIGQMAAQPVSLQVPAPAVARWDGAALPEPAPLPVHSIVPHRRNSDFVGRSDDLLAIARHLLPAGQATRVPAVAIAGIGGMGKTQLAVEFAFRFGRYFAGVYWISFARPESIADEIAASGGERGLRLFRDVDRLSVADQVARVQQAWQEETPRLLIFDNCEDEALLKQWLPVTGGCRVLLTTRRGSWARALGIIEQPLNHLARADSVRLLQHLAGDAVAVVALGEIAAEVGDLPLALHLAGSFLHRYRSITPEQYLAQIRHSGLLDHPSLRGRGAAQSPTDHELNVVRTFELNYARLNAADEVDALALRLLTHAACFASAEPIPRDLLLATVVDTKSSDLMAELLAEDGLFRLIGLGFLHAVQHDSVIMHRLVATFTLTQDERRTADARTAVENCFADLLRQANWKRGRLALLPIAASHIQTVLRPGLARGTLSAARLATWWGVHLIHVSLPMQALPDLQRALAIMNGRNDSDHAILYRQTGTALWLTGDMPSAHTLYTQAYEIHRAIYGDDHIETARDLHNIAILHARSGEYEAAIARYRAAIAVYERNANMIETARAHRNLGLVYSWMNELKTAKEQFELALTLFEEALGRHNTSFTMTLRSLAIIELRRREPASSLAYTRQAMEIDRTLVGEASLDWARNLLHKGAALGMLGQLVEALQLAEAGLARIEQLSSDSLFAGYGYVVMGQLHQLQGDLATARLYAERAVELLERLLPTSWETQDARALLAALDADGGVPDLRG
ncbi:MAG: tetratricopeptide repeat protein [Anaerolineae bacterium]|nr:tetratricopeptide repeat protein [Anaerolineae bacterium]